MSADHLLHASRAEQRRLRLLEAERELAAEEADALTLTEEQRQTLLRPFAAVKAEFADLDGLRWTQTALRRRQPSHRRAPAPSYPDPDPSTSSPATTNAFAVLTNADLASFAADDTIRVPHLPTRNRPRFPSPLIRGTTHLPGPSTADSQTYHPPRPPAGHRDGTRTRSPVKGLFTRDVDADDVGWTPRTSFIDEMGGPGANGYSDDGVQRPPPPGLAPVYSSAAAASSARRTSSAVLLESPAAPFSSSLLDAPPHASPRSPSIFHSSSTSAYSSTSTSHSHLSKSTTEPTPRTLSRTHSTSTSTSTLSILTTPSTSHPLPRRQPSKHGIPRPTRHAPSPPIPTHTPNFITTDEDEDDDTLASSLLTAPPPRVSSLSPHSRPRPIARSASFSVLPSASTSSPPFVSVSHSTFHSTAHPSPRARLASLLAHTPSSLSSTSTFPSPSPSPSTAPAPPPPLLRARSSSAATAAHYHLHPDPPTAASQYASDTVRLKHPPNVRGSGANGQHHGSQNGLQNGHGHANASANFNANANANGNVNGNANLNAYGNSNGGGNAHGGGEGDTSSEDEEWDAEETPRASPVETPGAEGARSPSRGWIRGFA